ncbi:hypothetical protein B0H13DRAFT_1098503 [Mycena leptocephala]|nr:hypothetical protein B0H13DRAFT_1098503 [Mycena leptocephala]
MRVTLASPSWVAILYFLTRSRTHLSPFIARLPPMYIWPDLALVPFRGHRLLHLDRTGAHLPSSFVGSAPSIIVVCVLPTSATPRHLPYCTPPLSRVDLARGLPLSGIGAAPSRGSRAGPCSRALRGYLGPAAHGLTYDGRARIPMASPQASLREQKCIVEHGHLLPPQRMSVLMSPTSSLLHTMPHAYRARGSRCGSGARVAATRGTPGARTSADVLHRPDLVI